MAYNDETTGLEVIPLMECVRLVETNEVARVAFVHDGTIQLYPINYAWDGEGMVFRTETGSPLADAAGSEMVAETDGTDQRARSGWSIIARGTAEFVDPTRKPELAARLKRLALYPWAGGEKEIWLRLIPAPMTGRRVVPPKS